MLRQSGEILGVVIDEEENISEVTESRFRPLRPPPQRQEMESRVINVSVIYEDKIKNLETRLEEYEHSNIELMDENDKLKENLTKLIKNYPKQFLFNKIMDDRCAICLEIYKYGEEIALTNCLHLFHKDCIDKSIEQDCTDCPKCRFVLKNSVFLYMKFSLEIKGTDFL